MKDLYTERLVPAKCGPLPHLAMIFAVIVMLAGLFLAIPVGVPAGFFLVLSGAFIFILGKDYSRVEYEYSITNGDIDISRILSKKNRRYVKSIHASDIQNFDRADSPRIKNDMEVKKDRMKIRKYYGPQSDPANLYAVYSIVNGAEFMDILDLDPAAVENMNVSLKTKSRIRDLKKITELNKAASSEE